MPLLKQFSDWGGAVKEFQPFGGFLAPERLSVLYLAVGGFGFIVFDASSRVNRHHFLQCHPKLLPEFSYVLWVIAQPKLRVEGNPRNALWFLHWNPVKPLRQPTVDVES